MQLQKAERKISNAQSSRFTQRIGSTVYTVNVYFKEDSKETLEEKMFRMMKSDLNNERFYGNLKLPQADAAGRGAKNAPLLANATLLPERGSV